MGSRQASRVRSHTETRVSGRKQPFLWGYASPEGDVSPWLQVLALLNVRGGGQRDSCGLSPGPHLSAPAFTLREGGTEVRAEN